MLLSLFVVSVVILIASEAAEGRKRKRIQNMTVEEFHEYRRSKGPLAYSDLWDSVVTDSKDRCTLIRTGRVKFNRDRSPLLPKDVTYRLQY